MPNEQVQGRACDVVRFKAVGPAEIRNDLVYSLDSETGVPLKIVCYASPELRKAGRPVWAWEADKLEPLGGRHVVTESTWSRFVMKDSEPGDAPKVDYTQRHLVETCEFDGAIATSTFWPAFPPGVRVEDTINHKSYREPGGTTAPVVGNPIRVMDSSGPWWGTAGAVTFLALVFVAILIRRRMG